MDSDAGFRPAYSAAGGWPQGPSDGPLRPSTNHPYHLVRRDAAPGEAIHQPSIPSRAARRRTGFLARLRAPWVANPKGKLHVAPAASNQARRVRGGLAGVIPRQRSNPSLLPHPERHHSGCSEDGRRGNGPGGNTGHPVPCEAVRIRPRGCRQLYNHGPAGGFRQIARSASGRCAKRRRRFGAPQRATSADR